MGKQIDAADILSQGILVFLKDGREALLKDEDVIDCAEKTGAFERAEALITVEEELVENQSRTNQIYHVSCFISSFGRKTLP